MALWESSLCNPGISMTTSFSLLNTRPKNHMNLADIKASKNDSWNQLVQTTSLVVTCLMVCRR